MNSADGLLGGDDRAQQEVFPISIGLVILIVVALMVLLQFLGVVSI